jgi:hypothetical protein
MIHYQVAELLALPAAWRHAFDLVEIITVQALPDPPRRQAIENIASLVAAEGALLVLAAVHDPDAPESPVPPGPLRQNEIDAFSTDGLIRARRTVAHARPTRREGLAGRVSSANSQQPMTSAARSITSGPSRHGLLEGPVGRREARRLPEGVRDDRRSRQQECDRPSQRLGAASENTSASPITMAEETARVGHTFTFAPIRRLRGYRSGVLLDLLAVEEPKDALLQLS